VRKKSESVKHVGVHLAVRGGGRPASSSSSSRRFSSR
jgi:hypothetical protein